MVSLIMVLTLYTLPTESTWVFLFVWFNFYRENCRVLGTISLLCLKPRAHVRACYDVAVKHVILWKQMHLLRVLDVGMTRQHVLQT